MDSVERGPRPLAAGILLVSLTVGGAVYCARLWWHGTSPDVPSTPAPVAASGLPRPEQLTPAQAAAKQLPHNLGEYRLASVVPEVPGHDLHALYESDHHISLFVRPAPQHPGAVTSRDVGPYWSPTEALDGHPTFSRVDVRHRAALAWIAHGKRHIVTGDVPPAQLRAFAEAYERSVPLR